MRLIFLLLLSVIGISAQMPTPYIVGPGVSHELAKWRAARYSDVSYKLNLTLEKMSPVLKGTMEIRVILSEPPASAGGTTAGSNSTPIILDWRRIRGSESLSAVSNVFINGASASASMPPANAGGSDKNTALTYEESNEHLIFRDGVKAGENVIKLDFTSPILTSGSAITRYVDKEDGAEYIYSLFVPSDASTAFPVFDQPDLKARFTLDYLKLPDGWKAVSNMPCHGMWTDNYSNPNTENPIFQYCHETKPISTYVFAFAVGDFATFGQGNENPKFSVGVHAKDDEVSTINGIEMSNPKIYVRKSQAAKFKPHAAEVFRLNREGIKFLESYFDYKFPFPKYDIVLIPEFPFGGMEHAGATFLRESSVIFPQEPTKNDYISRANVIFHEAAHQWFGDTVTMKWFDDLWLKEGFAEFMAYKALEKVMPEANAWKVFYERNKQAAYLTDSTKGTTPIYQEIANLNSAKSAYGNIVYRKAPSFLKQAEFYIGPDKFQTAVRAFLKKHEYANAGWEDLVKEFEVAQGGSIRPAGHNLWSWAESWVKERGLGVVPVKRLEGKPPSASLMQKNIFGEDSYWRQRVQVLKISRSSRVIDDEVWLGSNELPLTRVEPDNLAIIPNYGDYGYGIFLLDDKSRDYVLKNIQNEKDAFLRSMMWGSLWDSVREGELDPREYVELAIKQLGGPLPQAARSKGTADPTESDETIIQSVLGRVSTAMSYYLSEPPALAGGTNIPANPTSVVKSQGGSRSTVKPPADAGGSDLAARLEAVLLDRLQNAPTAGQRITFHRAFVANASTAKGREVLKEMLRQGSSAARSVENHPVGETPPPLLRKEGSQNAMPLRTKDRFDIVTRLIILGDANALNLLADLERTETGDDAKRFAYAARAGIATAENKAKYWNDFVNNKEISESWIEAAFGPWNSIRHADLTLPYLERALKELPNHKRNRKIFFVNGWLGAFIGGQRSEAALAIVNKFLTDNPTLDPDLRLKILENVDLIERAVKIRSRYR